MRRTILHAIAALTTLTAAGLWAAEDHDGHMEAGMDKAETVALQGEIVDITCYLRHQARGEKHVKCANFCADQAMPFGFVEAESGRIYLLLPDGHGDPLKGLREHFGQQVKVEGTVTAGNGLSGLQITKVTAL